MSKSLVMIFLLCAVDHLAVMHRVGSVHHTILFNGSARQCPTSRCFSAAQICVWCIMACSQEACCWLWWHGLLRLPATGGAAGRMLG